MENLILLSQIFGAFMIIAAVIGFFTLISKNRRSSKIELLDQLLKDGVINSYDYLKYKDKKI